MTDGKLLYYRNFKKILQLKLNPNEIKTPSKLTILSDSKSDIEKSIKIFDFEEFKLYQVTIDGSIESEQFTIIETQFPTKQDSVKPTNYAAFLIVLVELSIILSIDKYFTSITVIPNKADQNMFEENVKIRYLNRRDEKELTNFFDLNGLAKFCYKCLYVNGSQILISMSALKGTKLNKIHSCILVKGNIITPLYRKDKKLEFEVVQVYSLCKYFHHQTLNGDSYLSVNKFFELDQNLMRKKIDLDALKKASSNSIIVYNETKNKKIFELDLPSNVRVKMLCYDINLDYIGLFDEKLAIWLYRMRDGVKIASLPVYANVTHIAFDNSSKYFLLGMGDRRLMCLLIVDPSNPKHKNRISHLKSRLSIENLDNDDLNQLNVLSDVEETLEDDNIEFYSSGIC